MLKIRLRRMGAIRRPHYRIVVADARAPRDGRFLEALGHYNPITDPATIQIDVVKYEEWKGKGAQPTNAVASLVKQFNRAERKAAAAGEEAPAPSRRTRTASTKGINKAPIAQAVEVESDEVADTESTGAAMEAGATETSGSHMNEAMAEATRDGGEGSDAIIGESAETGTSANPGAATEEMEAAASEETTPADETAPADEK